MSKSKRLVFFGNERLATGVEHTAAPTLRALIKHGYDIAAVISNFSEGHSRNARKLEIAEVANINNIPVLLPERLKDIAEDIKNLDAHFGVLVAYGRIVPKEIIDIFPGGIINIHPSLLPKYRGPTPIEQVIIDGARETGTSIMRLVAEMDAGPIYAQERISLNGTESKFELADKLLNTGVGLLIKNLPNILNKPDNYTLQDNSKATYTSLLTKEDGKVNWEVKPAEQIEKEVRAYLSWPKSKAEIFDKEVILTKVRAVKDKDDGALVMQCQPGWLEIIELKAPSGKTVSGEDFLRGYKNRG
jgi:methionyl-tRNA formyltransferase